MNRSTQHAFDPEEVMAYLDGELEPQRAAALAEHLAHCRECEALAAQFRQVSERLLDFQVEDWPKNTGATVLAALDTSEREKQMWAKGTVPSKPRRWRFALNSPYAWALAGTLAVLLIVGGVQWAQRPRYENLLKEDVGYIGNPAISLPYLAAPAANQKTRTKEAVDGEGAAITAPEAAGPMIAQTATLTIVASNYGEASAAVDRLAASQGGYVQKLATADELAAAREFSATVRVPAAQLGGFLADLRKLGHVEQETRTNEEVTDQYVDLQARLKSARASEQRMLELLATRTGKLEDVLDAERELARIREEIESMEGQRILLAHRVNFATVEIQLREEYREKLDSRSTSTATKIWNAAVEGYGNLEDGVIGVLLFLLSYGPAIIFWLAALVVPGWFVWRRFRSRT